MQKRPGFTLAELIIAVLIFGFMSTSMATIYSTANRHMFQNYRNNMIKSSVSLAMHDLRRNLQMATRLDIPAYANGTGGGNELKFVSNVDQVTGCYPVNPAVPVTWHYFCVANDPNDASVQDLFHYTGTVSAGSSWCGGNPPYKIWDPLTQYAVAGCGSDGGTIIMKYSTMAATPNSSVMFSRRNTDNVYEKDVILLTLRSRWIAAARLNSTKAVQRDVDFTLVSQVRITASSR